MKKTEQEEAVLEEGALRIAFVWDDLAADEQANIRRHIDREAAITRVIFADMELDGDYGRAVLIETDTELVSLNEAGDSKARVARSDIANLLCRRLVGNAILQAATHDGSQIELLRFSRTFTEPFEKFVRRFNDGLGIDEDTHEEQDEVAAKLSASKEKTEGARCPSCGHPLQHQTDPCPRCTSKRHLVTRLCGYLLRHKRLVLIGSLTSIAVVLINLAPPIMVRFLIDKALAAEALDNEVRMQRVVLLVGIFFVLIIVRMGVQYVRIRTMGQLGAEVVMDLRRDLFQALQRLSLSYYDNTHTGRIMSRVLSDTNNIQSFVVGGLQQLGIHLLMVIGIPIIMLQQHWQLSLIALIPIPIAAMLGRVFTSRYKSIFRTLKRRLATLSAAVSDTVSGVRVVKSFAQEHRETARFEEKTSDIYQAHLSATQTRALFNPTVILIMTVGSLIVWLLGGRWVILGVGGLTTGMLVQFISYMNQLHPPVQQLIQMTEAFQQSATSAERVFSIMDMPADVGDRPGAKPVNKIDGHIEFKDVSFKYSHGERVLKHVSFDLQPGQMLGLVGETGSGKSTLASLICRFYDPTSGQVLLDGQDVRDITLKSLRGHIGMVLQSTFLFAGTIRDNLVYGSPDASETDIIRAAKAANAHDFIMSLPDAYDAEVGERGSGLSGGEKQRIAIARAILKDPDILILDEATSAVDTATEQAIQGAMDRLIQGRTTIAIAHRLSTLRNADKLLVLEKGEIVEQGSHDELLDQNGRYAKLCRIQAEFADHVRSRATASAI